MTKCKVCGFRLSEEAKKCPICGTMKGSTKAGSMGAENANLPRYLCPSCKADIIGEHRFCPSCGKELSEVANMQDTKEQSKNNCLKCGAYLPIGAKFCSECGAKQRINCHSCGATLSLNAKFCYECGAKQKPTLINANSVANASDKMEETPLEAFEYEVRNGKYILIGVKDTSLTDIVIPHVFSEIEGKKIKFRNGEYSYHSAFDNCKKLTSVTIPNSITKIGKFAFYSCSSLTSVTIPNSVTEIGEGAFSACSSLTTIIIPNSITKIENWAFSNCSSLRSVIIPDSVTEIGGYAFARCSRLTSITVPNSVTEIGDGAFDGCSNLETITIPDSVTEMGNGAFLRCNSLKSVSIETLNFKKYDIKRVFGSSPNFKRIKIGNNVVKVSELY